jgi:hypothetical protein
LALKRATSDALIAAVLVKEFVNQYGHAGAEIKGDDGMMPIVGFGSLLSRNSALYTFPDLQDFRTVRLRGFRRVFAHISPGFLKACATSINAAVQYATMLLHPLVALRSTQMPASVLWAR